MQLMAVCFTHMPDGFRDVVQRFSDPKSIVEGAEKWQIALNVSLCRWRSYRPMWIKLDECTVNGDERNNTVLSCLRSLDDVRPMRKIDCAIF
jgi:hypothetical protein